ncbi:MAG: pilin [Candidatus Altiarchaeota archaeon]
MSKANPSKVQLAFTSILLLIALSSIVSAQSWVTAVSSIVCGLLVDALKNIVGALAAVVFVYSGVEYVISQDDPGKRKNARDMMIYALVGIILVGIAATIIGAVPGFTGLGCT